MTSGEAAALPPSSHESGLRLAEWHASHVDDRFSKTKARCRETMESEQALHYLAHYSDCVCDFRIDALDDSRLTSWMSPSPDSWRANCERAGRDLSGIVVDVDDRLQHVRTGPLIRTVLQGAKGSMYCNRVVPGQYLTGHNFAPEARDSPSKLDDAEAADKALSDLVTALRARLRLGPQNPGGWLTFRPSGEDTASGQAAEPSSDFCGQPHVENNQSDQRIELCAAEVNCRDLHYVSYCRDGEVIFSVDHLGHELLEFFHTQIDSEDRRRFYRDFCRQFPLLVGQLGRMAAPLTGSRLERVVLDVEQGALYSYRIRTAEYLIGVTIDQNQVAFADKKMAKLARRMKER